MKRSKELLAQREERLASIEAIASRAESEQRELTAAEMDERDAFATAAGRLQGEAVTARAEEKAAKLAKAAASRQENGTGEADGPFGGNVKVTGAERTYVKGGQFSYLNDLTQRALGNYGAMERLARHAKEMSIDGEAARQRIDAGSARKWDAYFVKQVRAGMGAAGVGEYQARVGDLSTAAGAGGEFVPPAYLTAEYVPFARAGRVAADSVNNQDLPPGTMSINIPKIASGTAVASQGTGNPLTQNVAVDDVALTTEYVTFPVVTKAGAQTLSLQLLERSPIAFDDVTFKDLTLALAQNVDVAVLSGAGSGDVTGILNTASIISVAWNTGGTGGVTGLYGVVANAKGQIASSRFLPATCAFVTPERWEWLESQVDANGRPLVVPTSNGAFNVAQVDDPAAVAEGVTGGRLLGLSVYQDFNVPANLGGGTNQDGIVITKADDQYLYESPVVARALPQTYGNQLTVLLQVYEYMAFTAARYPSSSALITGSAMVNPITYAT